MNYTLLIYQGQEEFDLRTDPEKAEAYWAQWPRYLKTLMDAGVHVGGAGLELPSTSTTYRVKNGQRHVQDGPYADTKEQLGGFFIIDVPNLDAALDWAARCPVGPSGVIEVRPTLKTSS